MLSKVVHSCFDNLGEVHLSLTSIFVVVVVVGVGVYGILPVYQSISSMFFRTHFPVYIMTALVDEW